MLATTYVSLGRHEDAWSERVRAFAGLSAEGRGDRLAVAIGGAAAMELRAGRFETARALLDVEVAEARAAKNEFMLADALVRSALASHEGGDDTDASRLVGQALAATARIADPSLRERAVADARVADGAVRVDGAPLTEAIDFYRRHGLTAYLPAPYLYRARAAIRRGDRDAALADLDRGIAAVDEAVLDAGDALYEEAIRLSLDRGETARAFLYVQRAHASTLVELQRRLRGSDTTVLHLTALTREIVAFAVTAEDVLVTRTPFPRARLEVEGEPGLYDLLIRPSERMLRKQLIVVAGPRLERIAFAALYDTQRREYLIERASVVFAPSVTVLQSLPATPARSVVAVALPSGGASQRLPATEGETAEIRDVYREGSVIPADLATLRAIRDAAARNDVIHIAGHTTQRGDDTALLLADGERATGNAIAATPLGRRGVFVLAGCETLRGAAAPYVRSMSLGVAFVAAGAGWAIGTLDPIADEDARELFLSIHRQLAAGAEPAEAVRRVQLDALHHAQRQAQQPAQRPAWKSIAVITSCIGR